MTRRNLCRNPALDVDVTGWTGGSTPTRVTVAGFPKGNAARYTSGSFAQSEFGDAVAGQDYTLSVYVRPTVDKAVTLYLGWFRANGTFISGATASITMLASGATRFSVSGTAPAETTQAALIIDGENFSVNTTDISAVLLEDGLVLNGYADGDTVGWSWDGTAGKSSSQPSILNVLPSGLASAGAFGTAVIAVGSVTILPSGVATGGAFGSASVNTLNQTVVTVGITSGEASGSAVVLVNPVTVTPTGIATAGAFGAATVTLGPVTIRPSGIDGSDTYGDLYGPGYGPVGSPNVVLGTLIIGPTGIATAGAVGSHTVTAGVITIVPTGIASGTALGVPDLTVGPIVIGPTGIASAETFGAVLVIVPGGVQAITVDGIPSGEAFGVAVVTAYDQRWRLVMPLIEQRWQIRGSLYVSSWRDATVFGDEHGLFTVDMGAVPQGGDEWGSIPFGTKYIWFGGHENITTDPAIRALWVANGFEVAHV